MGELVNLRLARKARDRAAASEAAARNRASFGRSKAERKASTDDSERRDAALDAHRLQPPTGRPEGSAGD